MLSWFKRRARHRRTAVDLYGAVVTHARDPAFFAGQGVLDTPEGRTAMLILVLFPVLEKLQRGDRDARRLARILSETFVTDVDDCLREMGVGDLTVPKKVKRAAQALGERCIAYRNAAQAPEPHTALAAEIGSTVPGVLPSSSGADALARWTLRALDHIGAMPTDDLLSGRVSFPSTEVARAGA